MIRKHINLFFFFVSIVRQNLFRGFVKVLNIAGDSCLLIGFSPSRREAEMQEQASFNGSENNFPATSVPLG